ncbi:UDP-N-acetylmuramoyl-L-alanyl-D-glutamate--2,6-diaminopimelate ligase [Desertibacillus haloalkaliphilus]|uniref:UDP-N-acetylmuramoyl-L-alanyl-D-glutamate--2, 6-diaminopimelate ligase n=1 Tax=Desertibacillus haloalkaliphilus TaxID=1328930 RepID=UPI001C26365D|nr:UDP-N-acetylmuramoyl-L-alanyl-D-glutamate--2,6-diaminopimelate ligase [Desertibacillus haloalkaliphilus]MBU8907115.1 UDP-N-acetylmuramoyl-L-alanyl-D-glutamate--2,6-diaminopimelate ligase [Desertibacillus haloalkaliphilus]
MVELNELLKSFVHYEKIGSDNPLITSIEMDSREVTEGSLFICIDGYTVDGHDFVSQAVDAGAVAVLAERAVETSVPVILVKDTKRSMAIIANVFFDHPTKKLNLIGVTGTNGKTTITHLIEKIFSDAGQRTGLIGTMYTKIGEETTEAVNTTPESLPLQKTFRQMVDKNVDTAVMEVSSHALHLGRVRGCDFNVAIFTNLSPDHLDYHGTMEAYLHAKGLLFAQLGNTFGDQKKIAVLNQDDPASKELEKMTAAHVISYGFDTKSDVMATDIKMTANGTRFTISAFSESVQVQLKLIGTFSVYNVLAATAAGLASGIRLSQIKASLEEVEGVAGRFEVVDAGQSYTVIVDYAHTADSLENVLSTVKEFAKGRVYVVVGCGGDRDRSKRPKMAEIAVDLADVAIFTSDNPRTEDPKAILADMEAGVTGRNYLVEMDRKKAIEYATREARKDDVVVIAGKGHETYQIVGTQSYDFDDREVARAVIERGNI